MTVTRKGTRETAEAATFEEFQKPYHESVANAEEEEEEDYTLDSENCKRHIADWIG